MTARRIELDPEAQELRILFPYDPDLVEEVRGLPGRRFDREHKVWRVPAVHAREVLEVLTPHDFVATPEVEALAAADPTGETWTVSRLNESVRAALRRAFPAALWLVGEIQGLDRTAGRRHRFFELVEKEEGAEEPTARVGAVIYGDTWPGLAAKAARAAEPFALTDGIQVRLRVRVELYARSGRYHVVVEDLDPVHTAGQLALNRERILRELLRLGLRERNRARPFPALPLRVGVITSRTSDAWKDIQEELRRAGLAFRVTLYDARVQGRELKPTVLAGLRYFAARAQAYDVLLLCRGGGSRADLLGFDDLEIAKAVATHPLKVICGIGHERDRCVLDEIAHSVKTPTAAAACLVARVEAALGEVDDRLRLLLGRTEGAVQEARGRLQELGRGVARAVRHGLRRAAAELGQREGRLRRAAPAAARREGQRLRQLAHRVAGAAQTPVVAARERLRGAARSLRFPVLQRYFRREGERVAARARRLRALDPREVVRRGYGIVRNRVGRIVTRAAALQGGEGFDVEMRDGTIQGRVVRIEEKEHA